LGQFGEGSAPLVDKSEQRHSQESEARSTALNQYPHGASHYVFQERRDAQRTAYIARCQREWI